MIEKSNRLMLTAASHDACQMTDPYWPPDSPAAKPSLLPLFIRRVQQISLCMLASAVTGVWGWKPNSERKERGESVWDVSGVCPLLLMWWSWLCFAPQGVAQVMIQSFQLSSCALFNAQMQDVSLPSPRGSVLSHVPARHATHGADAHTYMSHKL